MSVLEVTAMTNFILAGAVLFASGILFGKRGKAVSASAFWACALLFMGLGALLGGIDHGFFEIHGRSDVRILLQKMTWISLGLLTFFALLTLAWQFTGPKARRIILPVGLVQLAAYIPLSILIPDFLVVILNYVPVMLLLLVFNIINLKKGTGTWWMTVGIILSFAASVVQMLGVDIFSPLDRNGLYHLVMLFSVLFLCLGGLKLKKE